MISHNLYFLFFYLTCKCNWIKTTVRNFGYLSSAHCLIGPARTFRHQNMYPTASQNVQNSQRGERAAPHWGVASCMYMSVLAVYSGHGTCSSDAIYDEIIAKRRAIMTWLCAQSFPNMAASWPAVRRSDIDFCVCTCF